MSFSPAQMRAWVKGAKTQVIQMHPALGAPLRAYIAKRTDGKAQTFLFQNRQGGRCIAGLSNAGIGSTMGYTELANDRLAQAIQTLSRGETRAVAVTQ